MARNSYFPGWLRDSDIFKKLTLSDLRFLIIVWGYADKTGKLYPFSRTARKYKALCRTSYGRSKIKLARLGLLCFARVAGRTSHTIWLAQGQPGTFAVDTSGPAFEEYRRSLTTVGGGRRKPTNNPGWFQKRNKPRTTDSVGSSPAASIGKRPAAYVGNGQAGSNENPRRDSLEATFPQQGRERRPEQTRMQSPALRAGDMLDAPDFTELTESREEKSVSPGRTWEWAVAPSATATAGPAPGAHNGPGPAQLLLERHCQNYLEWFGQDYAKNPPKELALAKRLLEYLPLERLCSLNDRFFESDDEYFDNGGYSFGVFSTAINALNLRSTRVERPAR